jgi:hypothetical protein
MPIFAVNNVDVNKLIAKILVYSAIKISANKPLLYSTLKPDTSSDSPSAKSKGVRLVSARLVMNHIKNIGVISNAVHERIVEDITVKSIVLMRISAVSRIKVILTS